MDELGLADEEAAVGLPAAQMDALGAELGLHPNAAPVAREESAAVAPVARKESAAATPVPREESTGSLDSTRKRHRESPLDEARPPNWQRPTRSDDHGEQPPQTRAKRHRSSAEQQQDGGRTAKANRQRV